MKEIRLVAELPDDDADEALKIIGKLLTTKRAFAEAAKPGGFGLLNRKNDEVGRVTITDVPKDATAEPAATERQGP